MKGIILQGQTQKTRRGENWMMFRRQTEWTRKKRKLKVSSFLTNNFSFDLNNIGCLVFSGNISTWQLWNKLKSIKYLWHLLFRDFIPFQSHSYLNFSVKYFVAKTLVFRKLDAKVTELYRIVCDTIQMDISFFDALWTKAHRSCSDDFCQFFAETPIKRSKRTQPLSTAGWLLEYVVNIDIAFLTSRSLSFLAPRHFRKPNSLVNWRTKSEHIRYTPF